MDTQLGTLMKPDELVLIRASSHRPVTAIVMLSQIIQEAEMSPMDRINLTNNLTTFHDILGGCERILRAPIPVSYTRHTAR